MCNTMTARQAASYLGISYWLILEMAKRGEIPHFRLCKRILFRQETLDAWLAEKEKASLKGGQRVNRYSI